MKTISQSHKIQKKMNNILAQRNISKIEYLKAFSYYTEMNRMRIEEGHNILTMPNLEKRIQEITSNK